MERTIEALESLRQRGMIGVNEIREMREAVDRMGWPIPPEASCLPATLGGVSGVWISLPGAREDAAILYLHGGGYVSGSLSSHGGMVSRLGSAAGVPVFFVDYRLAPEHAFPAAVHDATSAYHGLLAAGRAPERIVIAGDSAGGGLAMAALVALREAGAPLPVGGVCLSPWVDLAATSDSMYSGASNDPIVRREDLLRMATLYVGDADPCVPLASPLYADLSGLPQLLVLVGSREILLDDSIRLAVKAENAGTRAQLEIWEAMVHVWPLLTPELMESEKAIARIGRFVRDCITQ